MPKKNKLEIPGLARGFCVCSIVLVLGVPLRAQPDRLPGRIGETERVLLRGSAHPLAQPKHDIGSAAATLQLDSMIMSFKKTAAQRADLDQLLKDLQDLKSPVYHHWLTPEEYADRFGVSRNDLAKVAQWLEGSGFQVLSLSRGRDMILFSGTAAQVERALRAPIHRYLIDGEEHFAPAAAPSIPKELDGLVSGVRGLDDFMPKRPRRRNVVGKVSQMGNGGKPLVNDGHGNNLLVPDDLAMIYNLGPLYKAGADGSGQTIAVAGRSDIDMADVQAFRKLFNLPANDPKRVLVPKTKNPGQTDSMDEADLDLEWAGAMAPKAQILYVFSPNVLLSMFYAIDQALAPVLSTSFGVCEWHLIPDDFDFLQSYSQRAAAQGITWVSSSGDSGAAGCESQGGPWSVATTRLSVQVPAALPEVTAVGGTEFNEGKGTYFTSKPGPNGGTAMSYIPEMAWNDELLILQGGEGLFSGSGGFSSGGGGASIYFDKPLWQRGPGVPNDGARDVPDLSLNASDAHDVYLVVSGGDAAGVGGTSASAPAFAGMLALLNHYLVGTKVQSQPGLGNINPMLYFLGQNYPGVYHDVTDGGNEVPCVPFSTQDCDDSGVYGYSAGPGYDQATGWGSVDASKLVSTWAQVVTHAAKLVITKFTTSTQVSVGGQVTVDVEVANQGTAAAGAFYVAVLFTTDGTFDTAKSWHVGCNMKGAAVGQTVTCSGGVALDQSITPGTYYPIAVADFNEDVVQYDRTGNYAYSAGQTMTVK